jgi:plastocyanin
VAAALVVAAVGALAVTGIASPSGKRGKPEKVKVLDDFYNPDDVKIKKGKEVTWKWGDDFNTHDVTLKKGPKGVNKSKFRSQASSDEGFKFTKKFKKPGKYNFYCTLHSDIMRMKVTVKG